MSGHIVQDTASGLKVRAMPWNSNGPRNGTWWVGIRSQCRHAWESECCGGSFVIASDPDNRHAGAKKYDAARKLKAFIAEAQTALDALYSDEPYGAEEDPA